jgi:hypothetical protein
MPAEPVVSPMLDASLRDRAVYLHDSDALVLADLHLGRAADSAVAFPLRERADIEERLRDLLSAFDPSTVVFAGDVLHRFDGSRRAVDALGTLVEACAAAGGRPVLVAGNHDVALPELWDGPVHDEYRLADGTLVCHGHERPEGDADRYLVGHDHPVLRVEGVRHPCYLYGPETFRGGDVLMLPAFTTLAPGVVVNQYRTADFDSPLVTDADALRPVLRDETGAETLSFPPLGSVRDLL